jgi:hypothetical protein
LCCEGNGDDNERAMDILTDRPAPDLFISPDISLAENTPFFHFQGIIGVNLLSQPTRH